MSFDLHRAPADRLATDALAARGLEYRLVEPSDRAALLGWIEADNRGFHHPRPTPQQIEFEQRTFRDRRVEGVYDRASATPGIPVATVSGWPTGLSVPGGRSIDAWAVSSVTVAPTHRRRGIARALMEAQLRSAIEAGAAVAVLTATEATIYGRFGYAPATRAASIRIDRRRAHWSGADVPGRVHAVDPAALIDQAPAIARRAVARTPGEIDRWPSLFERVLGTADPDSEHSRGVRALRYDDERGQAQGFATYRVTREPDRPGTLHVSFLAAATDDAERGLWRALVEHDFISAVQAHLRSVEEPLPWLLEDPRAVEVDAIADHLWVRVLDPVAALAGRRFGGAGTLTLEVTDPLGHAAGTYEIDASADGRAEVRRVEGGGADAPWPADVPAVGSRRAASGRDGGSRRSRQSNGLALGVQELGAILLGGVRPSTLGRAGRIAEHSRGSFAIADRLFAAEREPLLSIWF
ncbi:GNAT family N-acetyltransferase [Agromyces sp. MMS24-K17]|uniref:GNAT family N-acetyltransferase n=1 Tax=Agromyces sp. MMS24-K17 TaxID=3372850 RepID=UPI00375436A3